MVEYYRQIIYKTKRISVMFSGHVYDREGTPLAGIKICDGQNICVTDENGCYSLPGWERARIISVQALTHHHDDWYRYIDEEYDTYDFYITPYASQRDCSFFHFSDSELFIDRAIPERWVGGIKKLAQEHKPDFIVHTGDICRRRGLENHRRVMCSENMGVPVRYTLGNHDYVADRYGEYTFERLYGPVWYSFDLGEVHFVVLPIPSGETKGLYKKDDRLIWLRNDLEAMGTDKRPVFLCHEPCYGFEKDCRLSGDNQTMNLLDYNPLAWVFGHLHINYVHETNGRIHIGTGRPDFGGIDGTPAGCRVVKIQGRDNLTTHILYNKVENDVCEVKRHIIGKGCCFTAPIYAEGDIFISTFDDGYPTECAVLRITTDGSIVWKHPLPSSVKWEIAYESGVVYVKDDFGIIRAIDSANGDLIWEGELPKPGTACVSGGLKIKDGKIYTTTNERAYVLDAKDGRVILESECNDPAAASTTVSPIVLGENLIWGRHWKGLICFDGKSGKTLWHNKDAIDFLAEPIVVDKTIFAPTRYHIIKLDENGNVIAKSAPHSEFFYNTTSSPLYYNGKLFVPTAELGLGVYNAETLEEITYIGTSPSLIAASSYMPIGEQTVFGKPIIDDGELIFTAADGKVYFCDAESYEVKRTVSIGHPILSGIVKINGGYCVADFDGGLNFIEK